MLYIGMDDRVWSSILELLTNNAKVHAARKIGYSTSEHVRIRAWHNLLAG